jgi:hypothetical protein
MKQNYQSMLACKCFTVFTCMAMVGLMIIFIGYLNGVAVDEERHLALAHQNYRSGKYREALEHGNVVYEKNPRRTDNLLLLGAIYYQVANSLHILPRMDASFFTCHFLTCLISLSVADS